MRKNWGEVMENEKEDKCDCSPHFEMPRTALCSRCHKPYELAKMNMEKEKEALKAKAEKLVAELKSILAMSDVDCKCQFVEMCSCYSSAVNSINLKSEEALKAWSE